MEAVAEARNSTLRSTAVTKGPSSIIKGWEKIQVRWRMRWRVLYLALRNYRSLPLAVNAARGLLQFKKMVYGGGENLKLVRTGHRYYFDIYAPGFPSSAFDDFVEGELNRIHPLNKKANALSFLFFAITRKCPLQCEHCFEWNNLGTSESFSLEELKSVVRHFENTGISQVHLSGGEPMVRFREMEELIRFTRQRTECWILTSGFQLTREKADRLKKAGAAGVVISLDHFDSQEHNRFRGNEKSFDWAISGAQEAGAAGLTVCFTICVTRSFLTRENLHRYIELAHKLGVPFVQLLEPKPAGRYEEKPVTLSWQQLQLLEEIYLRYNFDPAFRDYPVLIYHGYHQRRTGCFAAGNRNLYVDSAGYVHACPFCQTKNYHIRDVLGTNKKMEKESCPLYQPDQAAS